VRPQTSIALAALAAAACSHGAPPLAENTGTAVLEAYATASPAPDVSALYFTVENRGAEADTMVAVSTSVGEATLHAVETKDGRSSMRAVERLPVPAGASVHMRPGSFHVMLSALPAPLTAGDSIGVAATFVRAGTLRFRARVMTYSDLVARLEQDGADRR
jgi:copper(I)-binding protein